MNDRNDQSLVNFKIDSAVKESADVVLAGMGLNMSAYLGMCLRKIAQDKEIPFDLKIDPVFWVNEAKVRKAAAYVKDGAFEKCWGFYKSLTAKIENDAAKMVSNIHDIDAQYCALVFCADFCKQLSASRVECIDELSDMWLERWDYLLGNADILEPARKDVSAFIPSAAKLTKDAVSTFVGKEFPDLKKADYRDQAKKIDDILKTVFQAYEDNKDQLLMRFVGAEAYAETLETIYEERTERKRAAERSLGENDEGDALISPAQATTSPLLQDGKTDEARSMTGMTANAQTIARLMETLQASLASDSSDAEGE